MRSAYRGIFLFVRRASYFAMLRATKKQRQRLRKRQRQYRKLRFHPYKRSRHTYSDSESDNASHEPTDDSSSGNESDYEKLVIPDVSVSSDSRQTETKRLHPLRPCPDDLSSNGEDSDASGNEKASSSKQPVPSKSQPERKESEFVEPPENYVPSLDIRPIQTNKSLIPQRALQKDGTIPRHPTSAIFSGSSGSGKSTLLLNLLTRPEFLGPYPHHPDTGYFDKVFIFAPTAKSDDMLEHLAEVLDIPEDRIFSHPDPDDLEAILEEQRADAEKKGLHKCDKILFIFEDIVSNKKFMNSKPFTSAFIANRHFNASTYVCTQAFNAVPRKCRLQALNIFYYEGSSSELEVVSEEYCPPGMNKKEFASVVAQVTKPDHAFLYIKRDEPFSQRYRQNLNKNINFQHMDTSEEQAPPETPQSDSAPLDTSLDDAQEDKDARTIEDEQQESEHQQFAQHAR